MKRNEFLGMFAVLPFIMLGNKQENNNKQDTEYGGISVKCIKIDDKPVDMQLYINGMLVDSTRDIIILQSDSGWQNITKKYNGYTMDYRGKYEGRTSLIDWVRVYND